MAAGAADVLAPLGQAGATFRDGPGVAIRHVIHLATYGIEGRQGIALFARKSAKPWLGIMDFLAPLVPPGIAAGRLGNFINAELWGRPTDVPWAFVFPTVDRIPRHPSQLYELALEGIALFILLWWFSRRPRPVGSVSALFLIGYGCARFAVEYTREPDSFMGLLALNLSMGQWLSLPMIVAGAAMLWWAYRGNAQTAAGAGDVRR